MITITAPAIATVVFEALMYIIGVFVLLLGACYLLLLALEQIIPEKMLMFYLKHHNKILNQRREQKATPTHNTSTKDEAKTEEKVAYPVSQAIGATDYSKEKDDNTGGVKQEQSLTKDAKEPGDTSPSKAVVGDSGFHTPSPRGLQEELLREQQEAKARHLFERRLKGRVHETNPASKNADAPTPPFSDDPMSDDELVEQSDNISIEQLEEILNQLGYYGATNDEGYQTGGDVLDAIINDKEISFFNNEEKTIIKDNCDLTIFLNFAMLTRAQLIKSYADNPNIGQEL